MVFSICPFSCIPREPQYTIVITIFLRVLYIRSCRFWSINGIMQGQGYVRCLYWGSLLTSRNISPRPEQISALSFLRGCPSRLDSLDDVLLWTLPPDQEEEETSVGITGWSWRCLGPGLKSRVVCIAIVGFLIGTMDCVFLLTNFEFAWRQVIWIDAVLVSLLLQPVFQLLAFPTVQSSTSKQQRSTLSLPCILTLNLAGKGIVAAYTLLWKTWATSLDASCYGAPTCVLGNIYCCP